MQPPRPACFADLPWNLATHHDVGNGETAARLENAERFPQHLVLVGRKSGMASISPLRNSTFSTPAFLWFSRASASISSVMSRPIALPADAARGQENVNAAPRVEIKDGLTRLQLRQGSGVAAAERCKHRSLGQFPFLRNVVEIGGDEVRPLQRRAPHSRSVPHSRAERPRLTLAHGIFAIGLTHGSNR